MKTTISEYADGVISAKSESSSSLNALWSGHFEFALLGASWDARCTAICSCESVTISNAVLVKPATDIEKGVVDENAARIVRFLERMATRIHVLESDSCDPAKDYPGVKEMLWAALRDVSRHRPARVFIDITACPRIFTLSILAEAFFSGMVSEIVVGYSEGRYPPAKPSYDDLEEIEFSGGPFQAIPVPGYFGEFEPSRRRFYFISLGFEGWKILNLLIRKEPERVAMIMPSPGSDPSYEERTLKANAALMERFGVSRDTVLKSPAGDAIAAWRAISESRIERFDEENVYYLCSGIKPHSVAFALRSISARQPTLLYNQVAQHLPMSVECTGVYWAYTIRPTNGTVFG